jgi:UDP-N-acetylglucosamine diphosphorylase/glucosamine-1-phosphate N-acetyltransferase
MLAVRLCHFEDRAVAGLEPLTLTRPAHELVCGLTCLGAKQRAHFAADSAGCLLRPYLADLQRLRQPETPVNDLLWLSAAPTMLVNARWMPPIRPFNGVEGPCVGLIDDEIAYAFLEPTHLAGCSPDTLDSYQEDWKHTLPHHPAGGRMVHYLWDLVAANAGQLNADFKQVTTRAHRSSLPDGLSLMGSAEGIWVDGRATIEPSVVANTSQGPVVIGPGAVVTAFTRLEGPCSIGPGTHLLGAKIRGGTSLGPCCRVGGEVEASILHGYSNKYHDGFLGHAYLGEWVNLGAGTCNSDLRNDYGEVTVTVNGRRVATGQTKVGCFLGDHTKSGIGTLLNTGTNAGVFTNLLPSGSLLPKYVPSFASWWNGAIVDNIDVDERMQTAATVMRRRGQTFTEIHAAMYRHLFEQTAGERRRLVRESELRRLRRTA